jgi:hypothetical protein
VGPNHSAGFTLQQEKVPVQKQQLGDQDPGDLHFFKPKTKLFERARHDQKNGRSHSQKRSQGDGKKRNPASGEGKPLGLYQDLSVEKGIEQADKENKGQCEKGFAEKSLQGNTINGSDHDGIKDKRGQSRDFVLSERGDRKNEREGDDPFSSGVQPV